MKRALPLVVLVLLAALVVVPGPAQGEMYVEGYLGAVLPSSENTTDSYGGSYFDGVNTWTVAGTQNMPGRFDQQAQGGLKIGYWFTKEGFLGYDYPDWAKYFGVYLDFSFHKLDYRRQRSNFSTNYILNGIPGPPFGANPVDGTMNWWSDGKAATIAFMITARYGFLKDSEVPFGRLQPYIGVGPAVMISRQKRGFTTYNVTAVGGVPVGPIAFPFARDLPSDTSVDIALAVEAGVRWMCLKNVSLDVSFKYRYADPSYDADWMEYNPAGQYPNVRNNASLDTDYHLFSFQVGAAYHF